MGENAAAGVTGKEIWLDGEWVAWGDANIHVLTHTLHYGLGVFEGIRCYAGADGRSGRSAERGVACGQGAPTNTQRTHTNTRTFTHDAHIADQVQVKSI